ncbi:MAG: hypothetical protein F4X02_10475 [Chloroflexi bacterium]|nr:hypothetical protein [Chloroflexota bacterium]
MNQSLAAVILVLIASYVLPASAQFHVPKTAAKAEVCEERLQKFKEVYSLQRKFWLGRIEKANAARQSLRKNLANALEERDTLRAALATATNPPSFHCGKTFVTIPVLPMKVGKVSLPGGVGTYRKSAFSLLYLYEDGRAHFVMNHKGAQPIPIEAKYRNLLIRCLN